MGTIILLMSWASHYVFVNKPTKLQRVRISGSIWALTARQLEGISCGVCMIKIISSADNQDFGTTNSLRQATKNNAGLIRVSRPRRRPAGWPLWPPGHQRHFKPNHRSLIAPSHLGWITRCAKEAGRKTWALSRAPWLHGRDARRQRRPPHFSRPPPEIRSDKGRKQRLVGRLPATGDQGRREFIWQWLKEQDEGLEMPLGCTHGTYEQEITFKLS